MTPEEQKQIVRLGYDKLSYAYRGDDTSDDHEDYAVWLALLEKRLPERSPVLDIGCGCGLPATKLLAEHFDVSGVDFSEIQIRRAKRLVPRAHFVCGDISEQTFPNDSFAAVVSFFSIIHIPLAEHPGLFKRIASWLRPSGYLVATVGHDEWSGVDESYLNVPDGKMCWSHADESTNVRWLEQAGLELHWTKFVPEGQSGHTLVFAQKPPIDENALSELK